MSSITLQKIDGGLVINVPKDKTVIGRGEFLQINDKRISRSHAVLDISDDKLYIIPTHSNPSFLRSSTSKDLKILTRDLRQLLEHDDEIGLLADQFFYKVCYPQSCEERMSVSQEDSVNQNSAPQVTLTEEKESNKEEEYEPLDVAKREKVSEVLEPELDEAMVRTAKSRKRQPKKCKVLAEKIVDDTLQYYNRVQVKTNVTHDELMMDVDMDRFAVFKDVTMTSMETINNCLAERKESFKAIRFCMENTGSHLKKKKLPNVMLPNCGFVVE